MKPVVSGAADPSTLSTASADNSAGRRRRRQHRDSSPAAAQEGPIKLAPSHPGRSRSPVCAGRSRNFGVRNSLRSADGREREPESRGGAAVHPDGAEADIVRPNRADAVEEDPADLSAPGRRSVLRTACVKGASTQRLLSGRGYFLKAKDKKPAEKGGHGDSSVGVSAGCRAGLGWGLWKGGCLQAELIHFHLQKRLKRRGAKMQTKADSTATSESALEEPEPAAEATEAGSVTQQDQALEEEMERLLEENEDLKV